MPIGRKVSISRALADDLGVAAGDPVVLRVRPPGTIPADTTLGKKNDTINSHRMIVGAVLPDAGPRKGPAHFALRPSQIDPRNVFVSLGWLQDKLERPGMVNTMLISNDGAEDANSSPSDTTSSIQQILQPNTLDYGIRVKSSPLGYCNITSDRMLISPAAQQAITHSLADYKIRPVLAYLANTISCNGKTLPYSTVAAIDFPAKAADKGSSHQAFVDIDGKPIPPLADDEIVLNQWTAERLHAKRGDTVELTFFQPHSAAGEYREETKKFRLAGIAAMSGPAADRDLVPSVEGITDEATMADWNPPFSLRCRPHRQRRRKVLGKVRAHSQGICFAGPGATLVGQPLRRYHFAAGYGKAR